LTSQKRHQWKWGAGAAAALAIVALVVIIVAFVETGALDRWLKGVVVTQIEQRTGARAEIGSFHLRILGLRVVIDNLTLHGLEAASDPPFVHADQIDVGVHIISFFRKQISLDHVIVKRPALAVEIDPAGHSNIPTPRVHGGSKRPWQDTLFQLKIGQLALRDGAALFNDQKVPLTAQGQNFQFTLGYVVGAQAESAAAAPADSYVGNFTWQQVEIVFKRAMPADLDLSAKFTLHRDAFALDELICKAAHSEVDLRAELASFAHPAWSLHYRGRLALGDVRELLRVHNMPDGLTDFAGQMQYASATPAGASTTQGPAQSNDALAKPDWTGGGYFRARDIRMTYQWFHAGGFETWGDYEIAQRRLVVPNLKARALGGAVDGRLELGFKGLAFRTETRLRGATLPAVFAALNNPSFPVNSLHWDGAIDVDSVNTWNAGFKHFETKGQTRWSPPATPAAGMMPMTSRVDYDYVADRKSVDIASGQFTSPDTQLNVDGSLGAKDSALEASFTTKDLLLWNDFINAIRGPEASPRRIAGRVEWTGRVLGPIVGPTFIGHVNATGASYDKLRWDSLAGDFEYSPDGFQLMNSTVTRGKSSATIDLKLQLDGDWSFLPSNTWTLDARVEKSDGGDLQAIIGTNYPVTASLSGDIRGSGTRGDPKIDANLMIADLASGKWHVDSLDGQFHWQHNEIRLSKAELKEGHATIAGNVAYMPSQARAQFDVTGRGIDLSRLRALQTPSLPVAGELNFHVQGTGPFAAPAGQGTVNLTDLRVGGESQGDLSAQVTSDGQSAQFTFSSEPVRDKFHGQMTVGFGGDEPVSGRLNVAQLDLDPLIVAGLHLHQVTGHSSVDGQFTISGALRHPETIAVDADISRISFSYEFVQLTNDGDIRLTYRRDEVRVDQARLHGTDTDLQLSGAAQFTGERPLHFLLSGGVDLRLVRGVVPDLDAHGRTDLNVSVDGTISRPEVIGRARVHGASAQYGDFPVGLNNVNADFVFDKNRLLFERATAEAGGGQLALNGSVNYGEGPVSYQVTATTSQVRIRYPAGMSWLANGSLQLSGSSTAGLLSGRIQVQRLLMAQGTDVASFFASASETSPGPPSASPFLANLAFDVQGDTAPGARIEWTGAHVDVDGNVRLRGTWDRPVLLGDIHLLGGEMQFRGNTFQLTRGDINFSNPFRLDPVLNVEATSTISQYQVTIDFSGPASHLSLNYRSDPPLPDSDVVALLALGSPGEESGLRTGTSSANYGATALLSEAISTGISGRIEHLFGISQFRVDPFVGYTSTEQNAAARVTIQEQVARSLTITYSTNASTSNQYTLIQVEYAVKRDLSVVFLRDINGTYGLDIKWVKHFK
jgi:translocation and assembly module TamB